MLVAVAGGIAVAVQGQFMGIMDKGMGTKESVLLTYGLGGVLMLLYLLLAPGSFSFRSLGQSVPWYVMGSGILGLVIVASISYAIPRLGLATAFTIVIAAQFFVTALIEHYGWLQAPMLPMQWSRIAGFGAIILGVWLVARN